MTRFRFGPLLLSGCLMPPLAKGKLHAVTVTHRFDMRQLPMMLSAEAMQHDLHVLGMADVPPDLDAGIDLEDIWSEHRGFKVSALLTFAKTCEDDDVILYVDAYDSLLLDTPAAIADKFAKLSNRTGVQLLVSAEQDPGFRAEDYPDQKHKWRYLNSGGFIGTARAFKTLYKTPPHAILPLRRQQGDQAWMVDTFLNTTGLSGIMSLDHDCEIFQATCRVMPVQTHPACPPSHTAVFVEGSRVRNSETGTWPSVLHLTGPGHWPMFPSATEVFSAIRPGSCHYYETARVLHPEVIRGLEESAVWSGRPYSVICNSGTSLHYRVLLDSATYLAVLLALPTVLLLSLCWFMRGRLSRSRGKSSVLPLRGKQAD